ncbi:MAG: NAD-dependent epimerase/dehydratase family protein [Candidatus Omnitrophota bacterium]
MKILITGGMGFIGRAVALRLLRRDVSDVYILDILSPKIHGEKAAPFDFGDARVRFVKGDVSRREDIEPLLREVDLVLHLAAETGTGQSMYEVEQYNRVNISGTALMFDILSNKPHNVRKIVVASSRAIYGEGKYSCAAHGVVYPGTRDAGDMEKGDFEVKCPVCGRPASCLSTTEDSLIHPASFYGITKQFQEVMVMTLAKNLGISPVALRYQNVYGPGQSLSNPYTGIISIFSNLIRAGRDIPVFEDGRESRDFIYIDDIADATVEAMFNDRAAGHVLNVGSGLATDVKFLAETLVHIFQAKVKVVVNGKFRTGDIRHNYADLARARDVLGFAPQVSLAEGLRQFAGWAGRQGKPPDLYDRSIEEMRKVGMYK